MDKEIYNLILEDVLGTLNHIKWIVEDNQPLKGQNRPLNVLLNYLNSYIDDWSSRDYTMYDIR